MIAKKSFIQRPLNIADASRISAFISSQPPKYLYFFYAFGTDEKQIAKMLEKAEKDVYMGVFWQDDLIGIFMLRGWDEGYEIPSFGVLIDDKYRGGTLLRLTLDTAKLICRLSGTKKLMSKVHPKNGSPRSLEKLGFHQVGTEEKSGNIIYHLEI
jgi:RimJ/RimL family protein N-acetyltransferase